MRFKLLIKDVGSSESWELPFDSFHFEEELDKDRRAQISMNYQSVNEVALYYDVTPEYIVSASYREVNIFDDNDVLIYSGYISDTRFSAGQGESGTISIGTRGFFSLLAKRLTPEELIFENEDSANIAWELIDFTQSLDYGDFGITRGVHPTTKDRDRTFRLEVIADEIMGMSAIEVKDGYDFEIDNLKVFNIYYPEKGTQRDNFILDEDYNILTYDIIKTSIDGLVNQVVVVGKGLDELTPVVVRDSEEVYKENFFLLQDLLAEKDVSQITTLEDKGDKYIEQQKYPRYVINVDINYEEPLFTDYSIGDRLKVVIPKYGIDSFYRVFRRSCDEQGLVNLTLREV